MQHQPKNWSRPADRLILVRHCCGVFVSSTTYPANSIQYDSETVIQCNSESQRPCALSNANRFWHKSNWIDCISCFQLYSYLALSLSLSLSLFQPMVFCASTLESNACMWVSRETKGQTVLVYTTETCIVNPDQFCFGCTTATNCQATEINRVNFRAGSFYFLCWKFFILYNRFSGAISANL